MHTHISWIYLIRINLLLSHFKTFHLVLRTTTYMRILLQWVLNFLRNSFSFLLVKSLKDRDYCLQYKQFSSLPKLSIFLNSDINFLFYLADRYKNHNKALFNSWKKLVMAISYQSHWEVKGLHRSNINVLIWVLGVFYYETVPEIHCVACAAPISTS